LASSSVGGSGTHPKIGKVILVAVDSSEYANSVSREAARLSLEMKADVVMLSVVPIPAIPAEEGEIDEDYLKEQELELEAVHRRLIDTYFAKGSGLLVESKILHGDPADKIVKYADQVDADLVMIGTRGRGKFASVLLGSVSEKVAHHSKRSVLIVKNPEMKGVTKT